MTAILSLASGAANVYLESLLIRPKRSVGTFTAPATVEELHHDEIDITDHPVELGASISDHAFRRPSELRIRCAWSNSPAVSLPTTALPIGAMSDAMQAIMGTAYQVAVALSGNGGQDIIQETYANLYKLQQSFAPFDVVTGKRKYSNMLMRSLMVHTDQKTENILSVVMECREVIIATTQLLTLPNAAAMASPQKTAPVKNGGTKSLIEK